MWHFKKTKITTPMKKVMTILFIALFLFIGLKSFVHYSIKIDDYIVLDKSEDGQQDRVILTPKLEMIYLKRYKEITEIGVYKIKGERATHYLFGLYCIGSFPFGLRYYHKADNVFDSEIVLNKKQGDSFPKVGDQFKAKIVIFKERAKIGKDEFKRVMLSDSEKENIANTIEVLKSNI
jgi:hypothetical protein